MIRGEILITLKNGHCISYANKYLTEKTGTDEVGMTTIYDAQTFEPVMVDDSSYQEDMSTPLFKGVDGEYYCYTGSGNDMYTNQTGLGKIKGDYEYLLAQVGVVGNDYLRFPEADSTHADTTDFIRETVRDVTSNETEFKEKILCSEIETITVNERWIEYPYGREAGYMLPKDSLNFYGYNESKERKIRNVYVGPDFDAHKKFDTGFIPNPALEIVNGELVVANNKDYDSVVIDETDKYFTAYGVLNGKKSGLSTISKE